MAARYGAAISPIDLPRLHRMNTGHEARLLELWEAGLPATPSWRPARLLAAQGSGLGAVPIEQVPIGVRDAALLDLREDLFGSRLDCVVDCPQCRTSLEFGFDVGALRVPTGTESASEVVVTQGAVTVHCRLPNTADLAELDATASSEERVQRLLRRCVVAVDRGGQSLETDHLPASMIPSIGAAMAAADPQADVRLQLECPDCGFQWPAAFDIGAFLWAELSARAARLLREVHELAQAYGWSEREILSLTPLRRQTYLEMVRA
ncbi:MAG: hypothetical protein JNK85_06405 [Verrucomicrobiales bacterium]|nr:hypothetical protein [Verrucomicrobiales bacterium]